MNKETLNKSIALSKKISDLQTHILYLDKLTDKDGIWVYSEDPLSMITVNDQGSRNSFRFFSELLNIDEMVLIYRLKAINLLAKLQQEFDSI